MINVMLIMFVHVWILYLLGGTYLAYWIVFLNISCCRYFKLLFPPFPVCIAIVITKCSKLYSVRGFA